MLSKFCPKCKLSKSVDNFWKQTRTKNGLYFCCRECGAKILKDRFHKNKEKIKERNFERIKSGLTPKTKICPKCKEVKSANQFRQSLYDKSGLSSYCKKCEQARAIISSSLHKEKNKSKNQNLVERTLRCSICKQLKSSHLFYKCRSEKNGYSYTCKACIVIRNRSNNYGITSDFVDTLISYQNGKCPICNKLLGNKFVVDHDHITNKVRALLCRKCNCALGLLNDSPALLRSAASYLEQVPLSLQGSTL